MFSRAFFSWRLRALLPLLARFRSKLATSHHNRVLCVLTGGLGDKLMALPAVRHFRSSHAGAHFTLLFDGDALPFADAEADEVLEIRKHDTKGLLAIARRGYDAFFVNSIACFRTRFELAAYLTGATERRGPRFKDIGMGKTVYRPDYVFGEGHETRINFAGAGGQTDLLALAYPLNVPPDERPRELADIVMHPATSPTGLSNRWPPAHYAALARELRLCGRQVSIIGTNAELPLINKITEVEPHVRVVTGLSIRETAVYLKHAALLIGNDSGIGHLAAAVGTRVLTIFGANQPERVAPISMISGHARSIASHCPKGGCYGTPEEAGCMRCIQLTTVTEALDAATELLAVSGNIRS
jgi:ADP-heptose:LPS heptosyltransferase